METMKPTPATPAQRVAKHKLGVTTKLSRIEAMLEDLSRDLREVLETRSVRKSLNQETMNAD
jgi:hypothetical protein